MISHREELSRIGLLKIRIITKYNFISPTNLMFDADIRRNEKLMLKKPDHR